MAILSREEFFNRINTVVGDNSSDDAISFIEDMSDTYNAMEDNSNSGAEWERRYHENDEAWRKKYSTRFFRGDATIVNNEPDNPEGIEPEDITIDDLFE